MIVKKEISLVSRQGLLTTQTQNKTRQNYYEIELSIPKCGISSDFVYSNIPDLPSTRII